MTPNIVAVDHFAGVGWGVAAHRIGIREYGADNAASVIRVRSANGMRTIYRDVWSGLFSPWMVPAHRLYIASPPCQTFSPAGNGEGRQALDDVYAAIEERRWADPSRLHALTKVMDERTALVLTPLAHIYQHRPQLVALEQVPPVLPVWRRMAGVLRELGYSAWSGLLRSEQFGVPQTRERAILMARLDGPVKPPAPTHSRYYTSNPRRLDPGVHRWVSMAEALGWSPRLPIEARAMRGGGQTERYGERGAGTYRSRRSRSALTAAETHPAGSSGSRPGRTAPRPVGRRCRTVGRSTCRHRRSPASPVLGGVARASRYRRGRLSGRRRRSSARLVQT
ncbi:DNA cytosine methyltransferase [Streptomyces sp. MS2A]|nr:DNA cytosine methyltransferase [Streptomyces sp. MS2A]